MKRTFNPSPSLGISSFAQDRLRVEILLRSEVIGKKWWWLQVNTCDPNWFGYFEEGG
jgi:hypothetical protein